MITNIAPYLSVLFFFLLPTSTEAADQSTVDVTVKWKVQELKSKMEIYELAPGNPLAVWTTGSVGQKKDLPVGRKIKGGKFTMASGGKKRFVLVMENKASKEQYFFAAPHMVKPAKHSLGFEFQCLCMNHAFKIAPKSHWYRIVELTLDKGFVGKKVKVTHSILGTNKKRGLQMQVEGVENPGGAPGAHAHHH